MKILFVQTAFLGDVVLALPVVANLRRLFPEAKITFLTTPAAADLVRYSPAVNDIVTFDKYGSDRGAKGILRLAKFLRSQSFDMAVSVHKSWRTALLLRLAGIPVRYGFAESRASFLYSKTVSRSSGSHEILRQLSILKIFGRDESALDTTLRLGLSEDAAAKASQKLNSLGFKENTRPLIAIAPGSVWATKRWLPAGFSDVATQLQAQGCDIVLLGGSADAETAADVSRHIPNPVWNLAGQTSLLEAAAIMKHCAVVITNDSAPLHLASAVGTPTVAIFCSTIPEFGYGPWGVPHRVVGVDGLSCRPCGRHGAQVCPIHTYACQRDLQPGIVLNAVRELLSESKTNNIASET